MIIVADKYGQFLGKTSERITLKEKGKLVEEIPFFQVEQVLVVGDGISLSSDLLAECAERGIPLAFLSFSGKPYAQIFSPSLVGTVLTRREQILSFFDNRGFELSRFFIEGKIKNQIATLKYFSRHRKETNRGLFRLIQDEANRMEKIIQELKETSTGPIEEKRALFLSLEGRAASSYWTIISQILPEDLKFPGRERRGATDQVNSSLNYCYGILYQQIWNSVVLAGLDPFAGFLHADRAGKPSLVLDLIEEFRSFVVDRPLISFFNKGGRIEVEESAISQGSRKELARIVFERLEDRQSIDGKKHKIKTIIQIQARKIANFLRGLEKYKPFVGSW
ncbi:MAG: CRISPR-associated endonuclease Cas1 [Caldiserica bacterium]|jgi:CRISPR-associated protein Cas1|nr:CRISPR-associated endonuclease Cas1 [Caldisericota bacterium]MDH7562827.1 CRISPR-associated endonuclease Cas1 [Caldisericota bacterium]